MSDWRKLARRAALALTGGALACAPTQSPAQSASAQGRAGAAVATFASGCFWCTEADYEKVPGVVDAVSGYIGGRVANPTYEQVSAGGTGHREAVQVYYDPKRVSYQQLLDVYWRNVDPVDARGQFCDKGPQYTSAIYVAGAEERRLAEASKEAQQRSGRFKKERIVTAIEPASRFYEAEEYHQSYYKKNPIRYKFYRGNCGRDARLREIAGTK